MYYEPSVWTKPILTRDTNKDVPPSIPIVTEVPKISSCCSFLFILTFFNLFHFQLAPILECQSFFIFQQKPLWWPIFKPSIKFLCFCHFSWFFHLKQVAISESSDSNWCPIIVPSLVQICLVILEKIHGQKYTGKKNYKRTKKYVFHHYVWKI